jgi:hypothetical protein
MATWCDTLSTVARLGSEARVRTRNLQGIEKILRFGGMENAEKPGRVP